ncbi:MAG: hypothetical protein JSV88_10005 [Candidatus Aminicenantes bacterium]|nr:MAG: hypothetical protein JSV88_10005 [Candidatus Aminicenantes bacterium]
MKQRSIVTQVFVLVVFSVLFATLGYGKASTKDTVIVYDFSTGEFFDFSTGKFVKDAKFTVRYGRNVTFMVKNINPFLYKVEINGKSNDYFVNAPKIFETSKPESAKEEEKAPTKKTLEETLQIGHGALSKTEKFYTALAKAITTGNDYHIIEENINRLIKDFISPQEAESRQEQIKGIKSKYEDNLKKAKLIYQTVLKKICFIICFIKNHEKLLKLGVHLSEFEKKGYKKLILDLIDKFREEYFSVSSTFPTVQNDEVEFTLKITPRKKENPLPLNRMLGPVRVKVHRGWKMSFSTGILFGINAHDHTYRIEDIETEPGMEEMVEIKENEERYSITPVVMALMHIHPRSTHATNWGGFSFGLGTGKIEELNYYLGTSWIFGSTRRFILNLGGMVKRIDYLSPKYQLDTPMAKAAAPEAEKLVEKKFKLRFCLGITYNLK